MLNIPSATELTKLIEEKVSKGVNYIEATVEVARILGLDPGEMGKQLPPKIRAAVKEEAIRKRLVRRMEPASVIPYEK